MIKKIESFNKQWDLPLEEIIEKVPENQSWLAAASAKAVKKPNTKSFHAEKEQKEKPIESPLKKPTTKIGKVEPKPKEEETRI